MICILFLTGFLAIAAQSVEETGKITGNLPSIHSLNSCQYLQNISGKKIRNGRIISNIRKFSTRNQRV